MQSRPYHHGDLRAALVEEGLALLAGRAGDDLSLREVARAVGVSATAVYRHFPDKRALMTALAREGLRRLSEAQHAAWKQAGGGADGFGATGRAYVRFALANPALFRLIFANPTPLDLRDDTRDAGAATADPLESAFAFLQANAAALAPPGADPTVVALRAWALAHGLAMLMLDGEVPHDEALIDGVVSASAIGAARAELSRPAAPRAATS